MEAIEPRRGCEVDLRSLLIACLAVPSLISSGSIIAQEKNQKVVMPAARVLVGNSEMAAHDESASVTTWDLWEGYKRGFLEESGRIVDHDDGARTTSEAQAYGLFFALVANDRPAFEHILQWTQTHLASGDLTSNLPAWLWGCGPDGKWHVLDKNPASDADLWMAYTLIQAGRLWQEPGFVKLGDAIAGHVAEQSVVKMPTLGMVLLPAPVGFNSKQYVELNPSYMPVQLLYGLALALPHGPWLQLADNTPAIVRHASPHGFALDWVKYSTDKGWEPGTGPASEPRASFDAIRVYLWAGMADPHTRGRKELLASLRGMSSYMQTNFYPPMIVSADGKVGAEHAGVGYSAALLPFLKAVGDNRALTLQLSRLDIARRPQNTLYGDPPRYYDQNLALFGTGWVQNLFRFNAEGTLEVRWRSK
jgi:endoglucanase